MLTLNSSMIPTRRLYTGASFGFILLSSVFLLSSQTARALSDTALSASSVVSRVVIGAPSSSVVPRILFGGTALLVPSNDLAPFRDSKDGKVYIAPEMLAPLGITFLVDDMQNKVSLAGAEGAMTTADARVRPGAEKDRLAPVFVEVESVMEALGARCVWNASTNSLAIYSVVTDVQMIAGQLRVKATLPVLPKQIRSDEKPGMVILDFPGAVIEGQPRSLDLKAPHISGARIGQFSPDTARIVLEMAGAAPATRFYVLGGKPASQLVLNPAPAAAPPAIIISNNNPGGVMTAKTNSPAKPVTPYKATKVAKKTEPPTFIRGVTFKRVSDTQAQVVVSAGRAPSVRADLSKGRLTLDMVNATLSATAGEALNGAKHPFLKGISLLPRGSAAAQLIVDLTRTVTYAVRMTPNGGFILDLMLPKSAGGRLAGKLVVIDPGHGGSDTGARGTDGSSEKNVTLAISTKLADTLRDMGANVIMTRGNDAFIPVNDRPKIANRAGADFFISVHADSGDRNHSVNGSTIYYHMQMGSCKALAQSIVDELADMGGIRTKGTHSDGMQWGGRFVNGYGVLRGSQMVAVLCETGYMSNAGDVNKLNDPTMQKKIADAIANGLKHYVEGNPDFDTRNVQPQSEGVLAPLTPADDAAPDDEDRPAVVSQDPDTTTP
jgi:N-acetylmuramoyl-L-alanine amidase